MEYETVLKDHNVSVTKKRIELLDTLKVANKPVTIDQIKQSIGSSMDTSTIYRSLKRLVDVGIIYQTDFRDGVSYFEFQDKHHHHVVCTECKKRTSIDICIDSRIQSVEDTTGYTITNHMFELFGLCEDCS